jgi:hypothetical protein
VALGAGVLVGSGDVSASEEDSCGASASLVDIGCGAVDLIFCVCCAVLFTFPVSPASLVMVSGGSETSSIDVAFVVLATVDLLALDGLAVVLPRYF